MIYSETPITNLPEQCKTMEQKVDSHNLPLGTKMGELDKKVAKSLACVMMANEVNQRKLIVLELSPPLLGH